MTQFVRIWSIFWVFINFLGFYLELKLGTQTFWVFIKNLMPFLRRTRKILSLEMRTQLSSVKTKLNLKKKVPLAYYNPFGRKQSHFLFKPKKVAACLDKKHILWRIRLRPHLWKLYHSKRKLYESKLYEPNAL